MYSIKIKTEMQGFDVELTVSHDDPDVFYKKMNLIFDWIKNKQKPLPGIFVTRAPEPPLCPLHQQELKVSKTPGHWFCTARVGFNEKSGQPEYCKYMEKMDQDDIN